MNTRLSSLAMLNLGGGEIILILVLFFIGVMTVGAFGLVYLIVRAVQNRPPPVTSGLPLEVLLNQQQKDQDHVRLLSIFHFVFAGLALLGIAFLGFHYFMMHTLFSNPDVWRSQRGGGPPPQAFLHAFVWFYIFGGALLLAGLVLNVLSASFLLQRKHRLFSLIVAGLDCLQIPFGTALGIFTILVLSRDSVRELYAASGAFGSSASMNQPPAPD